MTATAEREKPVKGALQTLSAGRRDSGRAWQPPGIKEMKVGLQGGQSGPGAHLAEEIPGDENFPERKFQRAAKGPLRSLASEQPVRVREPPKAEEEPPERSW